MYDEQDEPISAMEMEDYADDDADYYHNGYADNIDNNTHPTHPTTASIAHVQPVSQPVPAASPGPRLSTIPSLFSRKSINLLISTPKIGRLRFLLPQLDNYAGGLPFLNIPPQHPPEQLGMIINGKGFTAVWNKLQSLPLPNLTKPGVFPVVRWAQSGDEGLPGEFILNEPYRRLCELTDPNNFHSEPLPIPRKVKFLIIIGLQLFAPGDPNRQKDSSKFLNALQDFCEENDCTVLGTVPMAKAKPGDAYQLLPHRVLGSTHWAESADCLIAIEKDRPKSEVRRITIAASAGHHPVLHADFDLEGRLALCNRPQRALEAAQTALDLRLHLESAGTQFSRVDFLDWGEELKLGVRTVDKWLALALEAGHLIKHGSTSKAVYQKPRAN